MQSIFQYRRFRKQVERQYTRHNQDADRLASTQRQHETRRPSQDALSTSSPSDPSSEPSISESDKEEELSPSDLEKGSPSLGFLSKDPIPAQNEHEPPITREAAEESRNLQSDLKSRPSTSGQDDGHLSRMTTTATHRSLGVTLGVTLTGINVRDRRTNEGGTGKIFVVGYEGEDDKMDPHNWSFSSRFAATMLIASIGFVVGFASAIDASVVKQASREFGVSEVTESLATGLYLIGFGVGALFAAPLSETAGRNPVYIATLTIYMIFVMASGLAPNIGAQFAFRFLAGFFGSTPLTCAGGSISDLWSPMERVFAFPLFANAAFSGPLLGPILGGFIAQYASSWRWVEWASLIMSGLSLALVVLFQPETYPPVLLHWKAKHMREVIGDDRYVAEIEIRGESFWQRLRIAMYRPFLLTAREPIIMLVALYLSVIYIVLFTFLDGYDYIFGEIHGTSEGITGLCFLGIVFGLCGASTLIPVIYKWAKRDLKEIQERGGTRLPPEFRLWFCMLGGAPAIPISLFWMGWTSYSWISVWSPLAASVLFGYGILCVFISSYQYIIDSYETYAASALVSVTLIRYVVAGGMTVAGIPFYRNMGVHWTLTILGGISAVMVPVPYLFFIYGKKIRSWSTYAVDRD